MVRGAGAFSLGRLLSCAGAFILLPVYTRILTPSEYGVIGFFQVVHDTALAVVALGLHGAISRYFFEEGKTEEDIGGFAFATSAVNVGLGALIAIVITIASLFVDDLAVASERVGSWPILPIVAWTVVLHAAIQNVSALYVAQKQFTLTSLAQFSQFGVGAVASILLILHIDSGAVGKFAGLLIGNGVVLAVFSPRFLRTLRPTIRLDDIKYALAFGVPTTIYLLANTIHKMFDRLILSGFVGAESLGHYTLGYMIGMGVMVFTQSFNQAMTPHYFELARDDRRKQLERLIEYWLFGSAFLFLASFLLVYPLFPLLAPESYQPALSIVPWVFLGYFFNNLYFVFSKGIFYYKRTKVLPLVTLGSALVNIGLNYLLIPTHGIIGAAIATTVSFAVMAGIGYWFGRATVQVRYPWGSIALVTVVLLLLAILGPRWWIFTFGGSAMILAFRRQVVELLNYARTGR